MSHCARPPSTKSSFPTRQRASSASGTRSWQRRSTRGSSLASARNCTHGWPTSSRVPGLRHRESSRRTGQPRAAARRRWPPPSKRRARRWPYSAWRRLSGTSSGRLRSGPPCPTLPGSRGLTWQSCAPGRPRSLVRSVRRRARSSSPGERSTSPVRKIRYVQLSCMCASGCTHTQPAATTRDSQRSSTRSNSPRSSHPPRSAPRLSRRSGPGCIWPGATRSRSRSASRRSCSPVRPEPAQPSCGHSPSSAAISPTSPAATRASRGSRRRCSSRPKAGIPRLSSERTSR